MFEPGHILAGRYEILGPLGQGGMAHVFAAHDLHLKRGVALKVLRPHLTETDAERFQREIQALARLSHPGIVTIFDLGLEDAIYFAMERIDGGDFTVLGPYEDDIASQQRFLRAAISVADTLGYVHQLGMVHRDLTPRNILLTTRGAPKLMDFGLVQLTEVSKDLTRTGFTLGTPHYMAPEQATGAETGFATDLYAFGAVLYRTVTGTSAFDAENDQAVLYQHVYSEAPSAIERNPMVPVDLSTLIDALLAKEPDRRPRSGYVVADALRSVLRSVEAAAAERPAGGASRSSVYATGPAIPRPLRERWRVRLDAGPQWPTSLAAVEGFLMVGLRSDALAVLRPADGGVVARFDLSDEVDLAPLHHAGRLWVSTRDGALAELAWPRGTTSWRGEEIDAVGVCALGHDLLVTHRQGRVARWSANRTVLWELALPAKVAFAPVVHGGLVLVVDEEGGLHALGVQDGAERFRAQLNALPAPHAASDGTLILQERSGEVHGFDLQERSVTWSFGLEGEVYSGPAVSGGRVYAASWAEQLVCISLKSGDELWSRDLGSAVTASPVVAAGRVWVATEGGTLHGFDAEDGRELARHDASRAPIQAPPLPLGGRLIVAATDGTLVAYD